MSAVWDRKAFTEVLEDVSAGSPKTQQNAYLDSGKFAVVDQGKAVIAGYLDDDFALSRVALPVIVFGDHTRVVKFINSHFA